MAKLADRELPEEKLRELKRKAELILANARCDLGLKHPFVGSIAMALNLIPTRDSRIPTACTNGADIYFDIDFMSKLTSAEIQFVLAHEIWHNVMKHMLRRELRDHMIFNIATDMEVNYLLSQDGLTMPPDLVMARNFGFPEGLSAEEYYDLLLQKKQQSGMPMSMPGGGSGDESQSKSGKSSKLKGQFDKHMSAGSGESDLDEGQQEASDRYGKKGHDPQVNAQFSKQEAERSAEHIRAAAVAAAQQIERSRGELPGHLAGLIKKLTEPELDWRELLNQYVTRASGEDTTWNRPNRRFAWSRTFLPAHEGHALSVAVGLDTSGSTTEDMMKFISEVNGIVSSFNGYNLDIIHCDTHVQHVDHFDESTIFNPEVDGYTAYGGGGTVLRPIFDHIAENNLEPSVIVMFTDGWIDEIPAEAARGVPTLWVLTPDGKKDSIKFGEVAKFKRG